MTLGDHPPARYRVGEAGNLKKVEGDGKTCENVRKIYGVLPDEGARSERNEGISVRCENAAYFLSEAIEAPHIIIEHHIPLWRGLSDFVEGSHIFFRKAP